MRSLPLTFPLRCRRWIRRSRLPSGRWATLPPPRRRPLRTQVPRRPQAPRHRCLPPPRAARPFRRWRLRRRTPPRRQPPCPHLRQTPTPRPIPRPSSRASGATWSLGSPGRVPASCRALVSSSNMPSRPCRCFCDMGGFDMGGFSTYFAAPTVRRAVAIARRAACDRPWQPYGRPWQPCGRRCTTGRGNRTVGGVQPAVAVARRPPHGRLWQSRRARANRPAAPRGTMPSGLFACARQLALQAQ